MADWNQWGHLEDWFDETWEQYLPSEYDPGTGNWSQGGPSEDWLKDLYDKETAGWVEGSAISYEEFKEQYGSFFEEYDPTEEGMISEQFYQKLEATGEKLDLLSKREGGELALWKQFYDVDPDDDYESITEKTTRQAEENLILNKKIERQKVINAGLDYTTSRNQLVSDSVRTGIRGGNADVIVDDLSKEFWSKMKVTRNKFEKDRLDTLHNIEDVIQDAKHTLANKEFDYKQTMEEAFSTGTGKIKSASLGLLQDVFDLREDFEDDTWDTMGQLVGLDALVKDCDPGDEREGFDCVRGKWVGRTYVPTCAETHGEGFIDVGGECVNMCELGSYQAQAACRCWENGDCGDHNAIMIETKFNQGQDCTFDNTGNMVSCNCALYCWDGSCSTNGRESGCPKVEENFQIGEEKDDDGNTYEWTDANMEPGDCEGVWDDGDCYNTTINPDGSLAFTCVGPACAIGLTLVTEMFKDNPFWERQPGESGGENVVNNILTAIVWAKLVFACIPENTKIDTPIGNKKIDDIRAGDIVIGYEGTPVKVLQKHEYAENLKAERFLKITLDDNSIVKLCDMHRMNNTRAKEYNIGDMVNGKTIIDIEWYGNVNTSYDLLTEDAGYRISGMPVNTMIGEMMEKTLELSEGELNGTT